MQNQKKNPNTKKIIIAVVVLAVLVAGFLTAYLLLRDKPVEGAKAIAVTIIVPEQSDKVVDIQTDALYLRGALEEKNLISGTESTYGLFVTTVDGVTADEAKQEWWSFSKGGESLMTGVDETPVADGDKFEITLMTGYDF